MKRKTALLVLSGFIGLVTATAYSSRINRLRDDINQMTARTPVLIAARNIEIGHALEPDDVHSSLIPKQGMSARSVVPEDADLVLGRKVQHPIPKDDPLLWTDFPEGPRVKYPSERIPPGFRAIALPADEIHTMVHMLSPGDTVDVVFSYLDGPGEKTGSRFIAQKVTVLGVGTLWEGPPDSSGEAHYPLSVSLLADPVTAVAILRASQKGEIHLLVRGRHLLGDSGNPVRPVPLANADRLDLP